MEGPDQSNPCAICLGGMDAGGGEGIFMAECSHGFHFRCIAANVAHGNFACPLCNAQWCEVPFMPPLQPPPPQQPMHAVQPPLQPAPPEVFDDDEQVEPPSGLQNQRQAEAASVGALVVATHTEYPAIARPIWWKYK